MSCRKIIIFYTIIIPIVKISEINYVGSRRDDCGNDITYINPTESKLGIFFLILNRQIPLNKCKVMAKCGKRGLKSDSARILL